MGYGLQNCNFIKLNLKYDVRFCILEVWRLGGIYWLKIFFKGICSLFSNIGLSRDESDFYFNFDGYNSDKLILFVQFFFKVEYMNVGDYYFCEEESSYVVQDIVGNC